MKRDKRTPVNIPMLYEKVCDEKDLNTDKYSSPTPTLSIQSKNHGKHDKIS
jgi:hypothetical protein